MLNNLLNIVAERVAEHILLAICKQVVKFINFVYTKLSNFCRSSEDSSTESEFNSTSSNSSVYPDIQPPTPTEPYVPVTPPRRTASSSLSLLQQRGRIDATDVIRHGRSTTASGPRGRPTGQ